MAKVRQIGLLPGCDKEIAPEPIPAKREPAPAAAPSQRKCSDHVRATSIAAKPLTKQEVAAAGWDQGLFAAFWNPDTAEAVADAPAGPWDADRPITVGDCEMTGPESIAWQARGDLLDRLAVERAAGAPPLDPQEAWALQVHAVAIATARPYPRAALLLAEVLEKRPCAWVSCSMHLGIEVREDLSGSLKVLWPSVDPQTGEVMPDFNAMPETCVLDVVRRVAGEGRLLELEEIAHLMNRSLERIHQIESEALQQLRVRDMIRSMIEERGGRMVALRIPDAARKKG